MATAVKEKTDKKPNNALKSQQSVARKTYLEVMRIIAAFLVIVNHTNSDVFLKMSEPPSFTWYFSLTYFYISKIAVPVFFMIMGGLLLQKVDPVKKSLQRIGRAVAVALIYSGVYYYYFHSDFYYKQFNATPPEMSFKEFFKMIFTSRATNAFWYLYAYIGLLILLPILQRLAQGLTKGSNLYLVILSVGVMGIIPLINIFHQIKPHNYLTDDFITPHIGMLFLGLYIEKHLKIDYKIFTGAIAGFALTLTFNIVKTYEFYHENPESFVFIDNWRYLNITFMSLCFYIIIEYLANYIKAGKTVSTVICYIGSLTFGVYLISDLVIHITRKFYTELQLDMKIIPATILWELVIFGICAAVTAILKLIPGFKKLI